MQKSQLARRSTPNLYEKLQDSDAVVVLWSANSVKSDYVKEEAEYAKSNCVLVPLRIDDTSLPFGFARIHTTDIMDWHGSIQDPEWRNVVDAIEFSLAARTSVQPEAPEEEQEVAQLVESRRSVPLQAKPVKRTGLHVNASALLAIAIVMIMLLGIFVFALRLV